MDNPLQSLVLSLASIAFSILWLAGFVIAKGFWSTFFCFIPFYAWYLVVEKIMIANGWN